MEIKTVGELKQYIRDHDVSPERFGITVQISNMTIRRLLTKSDDTKLPHKYVTLINTRLGVSKGIVSDEITTFFGKNDFKSMISDLEKSGESANLSKVKSDLKQKLKDPSIGQAIRQNVKTILECINGKGISLKNKAIAIGALLYLINPLDLIPDSIPVAGYLDDFAVLTIAVSMIQADVRKLLK